jgi:hypothetical protein
MFNQVFSLSFAESSGEAAEVKIRSFEIICFFLVIYGAKLVRSFHGFHRGNVLVYPLDGHRFFTVHRFDGGTVELKWFVYHIKDFPASNLRSEEGAFQPRKNLNWLSATCLGHFSLAGIAKL